MEESLKQSRWLLGWLSAVRARKRCGPRGRRGGYAPPGAGGLLRGGCARGSGLMEFQLRGPHRARRSEALGGPVCFCDRDAFCIL